VFAPPRLRSRTTRAGIIGARLCRSMSRKARSSTAPAAAQATVPGSLQPFVLPRVSAMMNEPIPRVAVTAPATSSTPRSVSPGTSTRVPISTRIAIGALMNSTQRQLRYSVSAPPSSRPTTEPRPPIAP
jgi:hypothetical protein